MQLPIIILERNQETRIKTIEPSFSRGFPSLEKQAIKAWDFMLVSLKDNLEAAYWLHFH